MSYQYINPNIQYNQYNRLPLPYYSAGAGQNISYVQYAQNPYQASFYNQNNIYPYNPNFTPDLTKGYTKIKDVVSDNGEIAHFYKLNNGHEVVIMTRNDQASIVQTFIDTGSTVETDKHRGVSHLDEHGLFKGTTKFKDGDIFRLTGLMGANTNASTDYAEVNCYITAPYMGFKELDNTLEMIGDMVYNAKFDPETMDAEKGPVCSEISMINDNPATNAFDKCIRNLFQIRSNSKNMVAGSIDTVKSLSADDMQKYYQTYYTPENMHTVIIASDDIDPDKIMKKVAKYFVPDQPHNNIMQPKKEILTPIQGSVREDIITPKATNSTSYISFAGPAPSNDKEFIIYQMIDFYLSNCSTSQFKEILEDMNAGFDTAAQKVGLKENDPYAIVNVIDTNPNDEQKALDAFYDAIYKLQNTPITDDELVMAKNYMKKQHTIATSDSVAISDILGQCMLDKSMTSFTIYKDMINSITKEDIQNFARKYLDLNKASIVVVHPNTTTTDQIMQNYSQSKYSMQNINRNNKISFKGSNKNKDDVKECVLPNNTRVALNKTNSDLCVFNWSVNTPPIKPKNANIPDVLQYMFTKGTDYKNQKDLEKYQQLNGIDSYVFVNGKTIEISANCMPDSSKRTLELLNELMYHPNLTQKDFDEAKRNIKQNLELSQKDAGTTLLDRLYPDYFPSVENKLKTIDKLTLDDVKEFYNQLLQNASSNFVATMPYDRYPYLENQVLNIQNDSSVTFATSVPQLHSVFEATPEATVVYDTDDLNQAQIYKSYKFPMTGNVEDEAKFEMLNYILGGAPNSRLFSDLREKQNLAYSVSSSIQSFENTGILTLKIQTTTDHKEQNVTSYDNVQKSLDGFQKHIDDLCNNLITDEELKSAKEKMKQNVIGERQNPLSETSLISMNMLEPYGIERIDEYVKAIDKITKKDIQKAAQYIFSYNPTTSILASPDTINSQMDYLQTLGKVQCA